MNMNNIKQILFTYRGLSGLLFFFSVTGMGFAYFFYQKFLQLEPCPLCIFQRVGLIVMGIFALLAFVINPKKVWSRLLLAFGALLGIGWSVAVAIRHVWLQSLPPDEVPSCGPGLNYWLDTLPIAQVVTEVFKGSGECAEIDWTFLGTTLPQQSLTFFLFLVVLVLLMLVKSFNKN